MAATQDFYGKDVTEAIDSACVELGVSHDQLDIEILETGSAGIFGFARKQAHIRVTEKLAETENPSDPFGVSDIFADSLDVSVRGGKRGEKQTGKVKKPAPVRQSADPMPETSPKIQEDVVDEPSEASEESVELVKKELLRIVELMGFPSQLEVTVTGLNLELVLRSEFESELIGEEGKVLDSLQYLVRKIVGRKVQERLRISLDVGQYREQRLEALKLRAVELAAMVREDGKTQAISALSPSERREIHLVLQKDTNIRSRSVGDGIFKKILIYKPGSGNKKPRRPSRNRGRSSRKRSTEPGSDK